MVLVVLAAAYGAVAGLLLPRPAHRLGVEPGQEWRAVCPGGHALGGAARGWLGTARCAACGPDGAPVAYGPGAALMCAATGLACALLAAATGARPELAVWLLLTPVAVLLIAVDRRVRRLPDALTLALAGAAAALLGLAALLPRAAGSFGGALLGGAALGGFYFLLFVIRPGAMGFGDVKLAIGLGVALGWYGWAVLIAGGAAGIGLGGLYGAAVLLARPDRRKTPVPFGPFMIIGAFAGLLLGAAAAA